jgi:hypothetical protein
MDVITATTELASCAEVLIGKNVDKAKTNEKGNGYPLIVGASDIQKGRIACKRYVEAEKVKKPVFAQRGDIILSVVGTLGKIGVMTEEKAVLSAHVVAIRPKEGVSMPYLAGILGRMVLDIPLPDEFATGFSRKLDIEALKRLRFTLPNLIVQEYLLAQMASICSLSMALHADKEVLQDADKLIDYLAERHALLREQFREIIGPLGKLVSEISTWKSEEETDYLKEHFSGILDRIKKI